MCRICMCCTLSADVCYTDEFFPEILFQRTKNITTPKTIYIGQRLTDLKNMFVDKVIVYADRVEVVLYYGSDLLKLISSEYANAPTLVRFPIKDFLINFENKKRKHNFFKIVFSLAEKERFELSRRLPDLHP